MRENVMAENAGREDLAEEGLGGLQFWSTSWTNVIIGGEEGIVRSYIGLVRSGYRLVEHP